MQGSVRSLHVLPACVGFLWAHKKHTVTFPTYLIEWRARLTYGHELCISLGSLGGAGGSDWGEGLTAEPPNMWLEDEHDKDEPITACILLLICAPYWLKFELIDRWQFLVTSLLWFVE